MANEGKQVVPDEKAEAAEAAPTPMEPGERGPAAPREMPPAAPSGQPVAQAPALSTPAPIPLRRLPILTYHSIDDSHSPISIAPADFRTQMQYLRSLGWRTLRLDEFLAGHRSGQWPPATFLLTFDDGFRNFMDQAYPVLRELGYTAIVFAIPDWVGATNDWPTQPRWVPRLPLLGWSELRALAEAGMELGAHSLSHPRLLQLAVERARFEITESQRVIEQRTGYPVQAFAYPYGTSTRALEAVVAANYRAGFGTTLGFATRRNRVTRFNRIDMYYVRSPLFFRALSEDWLNVYLFMRRLLRFE